MRLSLAAGLALLLPVPAAQAEPSLAPLKPCYVSTGRWAPDEQPDSEPVRVEASGFTPGARLVALRDAEVVDDDLSANAAGDVRTSFPAPLEDAGEREFTVTLSERDRPERSVTRASRVTVVTARARPRKARPTDRVVFTGRGLTRLGRPVWGHYVRRGKVRRTVRFARRPAGPCGTFRVRRRQMPFDRPAAGRWLLRIDQQRRYRPAFPGPFAPLRILVRPRPR